MTAQEVINDLPLVIVHEYDMEAGRWTGHLRLTIGRHNIFSMKGPFQYTLEDDGAFHKITNEHCTLWIHNDSKDIEIEAL